MAVHALMFGWEYPPVHLGGLGVACQGLVRGLVQEGVQVTLVLPNPGGEKNVDVRYPTESLCETLRVPSMLSPYGSAEEFLHRVRSIPREAQQIYGQDLGEAIERFTAMSVTMTRDVQPDVVHCHDWMTYAAGARAALHHAKPLVAHIHATELDRTHFQPDPWIFDQEMQGFRLADRIIAVSQYTKNILTRHYGIDPQKIIVVHNGAADMEGGKHPVLHARHRRGRAHPMVLFLGRLTVQKGPWQFLDMAADVHRQRPDVQFVMAGDGHMLPELMQRACDLGLERCVVFAGKVSDREARELYRHASCFVMPSVSEPFGLVGLEAAAHGTPVILSRQSGVSEVLNHALLVDFWDTEKMADCVLTVLREEPLAAQLRAEAPRALQHLTWQRQASKVRMLYEHLQHSSH